MKLKKPQLFLIVYSIICIARFGVARLYPIDYAGIRYVFDGMLLGLVILVIIYYARIYVTALIKNKKEQINNRSQVE